MVNKQWGFFNVPHLLRHGSSVYNGQLRGSGTLGPVAERIAAELSLQCTCFNDLGLSRPGKWYCFVLIYVHYGRLNMKNTEILSKHFRKDILSWIHCSTTHFKRGLIDWIVFFTVSTIFQPYNGGYFWFKEIILMVNFVKLDATLIKVNLTVHRSSTWMLINIPWK